jgi:hypothetical protein
MPDKFVRRVGEVFDIDERSVIIGVDYDTISLQVGGMEARLSFGQYEELAGIMLSAYQQAAVNFEEMRADGRVK